jgi:hypothetical protein
LDETSFIQVLTNYKQLKAKLQPFLSDDSDQSAVFVTELETYLTKTRVTKLEIFSAKCMVKTMKAPWPVVVAVGASRVSFRIARALLIRVFGCPYFRELGPLQPQSLLISISLHACSSLR